MLVELNNKQETNGQDDFQSSALLELTNLVNIKLYEQAIIN